MGFNPPFLMKDLKHYFIFLCITFHFVWVFAEQPIQNDKIIIIINLLPVSIFLFPIIKQRFLIINLLQESNGL